MAENYMSKLGKEFEELKRQKLSERQVKEYIELLLPLEKTTSLVTAKNVKKLRDDLRARYYDSSIKRFITEDPAKDGSNWYAYCGNNPVMMFDPSGLAIYVPENRNEIQEYLKL